MLPPPTLFTEAAQGWHLERLYADLAVAKGQFASHKKPGLTSVEKVRLRGLLCGYSPAEIAQQQFTAIKTVEVALSQTLYRYVEALTARSLNTLESWRNVADWLRQAGYENAVIEINWQQVPDVPVFYGRQTELSQLRDWVEPSAALACRLITLYGPGGIGKTTLAIKLAEATRSRFDCLIWQSLRHRPQLTAVLSHWLKALPQLPTAPAASLYEQISQLMAYLRDRRCLILLDNLDTVLQPGNLAGQYQETYRDYSELIRRLGEEQHTSCVIITSRELTREIARLTGPQCPVRSLKIQGLGPAARQILAEENLQEDPQWNQLIRIYRGNPLILKLVSNTIREIFSGSVISFLRQGITLITSDVSRLIEQQFERLCPAEQSLLYRLARAGEPLPPEALQQPPGPETFQALESLVRRSLVERSAAGFTLRPVVKEYVYARWQREQRETSA
ncbi:AAA family ATPase [Romeria aff. gracilis LEGE 07310]|uniref:AAA family ATPase n=1 Tax=Vasconcelosia minhoensis LEGE 07310 TaxID=915328 RepID=A0A8J7DP80_9CYAN|nr:AAA family ATPase [Romeria gracilis]MBE9079250.1 AAA family ATPase [Romeria aff. gracilis LEGE 07310]